MNLIHVQYVDNPYAFPYIWNIPNEMKLFGETLTKIQVKLLINEIEKSTIWFNVKSLQEAEENIKNDVYNLMYVFHDEDDRKNQNIEIIIKYFIYS